MKIAIKHMAVLIPACNEEALLPRCLASILRARTCLPLGVTCNIMIAVDASTDGTLAIASRTPHCVVVETSARCVGLARSVAAEAAFLHARCAPDELWLANTDADCEVPADWLIDQWMMAEAGAHALAGIVDVNDFSEHAPFVPDRFRATYLLYSDGTHPHIHGANLGIRGDIYRAAGGWSPLLTAEDHDLWNRIPCRTSVFSPSALRVTTSGRRCGRAPHGFADALAAHNEAEG